MGCKPVLVVSIMSENNFGRELDKRQTSIISSCGTKENKDLVDMYSIQGSAIMITLGFDVSTLEQEGKRALEAGLANALSQD